jgi:lipoprotein NlpI
VHDDGRALADYDEAIRLRLGYGEAYSNRGVLKLARGETSEAIADFDAAISINPRDVTAWLNRASSDLVADRNGDALRDFTRAIDVDPGNAAAYLGRGRAALFSGDDAQSIKDFSTAVRLLPTSPYTVLWLHIARVHMGQDDAKEFKENSARVRRETWPGLLINLYEGRATPDEIRRTASMGSAQDQSRLTCEVDFYIGEYAAHHSPKSDARRLLQVARNECSPQEANFVAAKVELSLLDR